MIERSKIDVLERGLERELERGFLNRINLKMFDLFSHSPYFNHTSFLAKSGFRKRFEAKEIKKLLPNESSFFNWSTPAVFYKFFFMQTDILEMPVSLPVQKW